MLEGTRHTSTAKGLSDKTHGTISCQLVDSLLNPQMCVLRGRESGGGEGRERERGKGEE